MSNDISANVTRRGKSWWASLPGDDIDTPHATRREAIEHLAAAVEVRETVAVERERRELERTVAPLGWRFTSWDDVAAGDVVRTPRRCVRADPGSEDGPLSPQVWGDPVTLTEVRYLETGCIVAFGADERGNLAWLGMGVLLITPAYREVGVLVRDGVTRSALPTVNLPR